MRVELGIDVAAYCSVCGRELRIVLIDGDGFANIQVTTDPCEKCAEKEAKDGTV